jgi:hypothetical protein
MKLLAAIVATVSLVFAGAAKAAGAYQIVVVPPSTGSASPGVFRINVETGQVVNVWGWGPTAKVFADSGSGATASRRIPFVSG